MIIRDPKSSVFPFTTEEIGQAIFMLLSPLLSAFEGYKEVLEKWLEHLLPGGSVLTFWD